MGLDMNLTRRRYIKNWNYMKEEDKHELILRKGGKEIELKFPVREIVEDVAYWRKANAIHNWFVQNTQDGEDQNGQDTYVSVEQLKELRDLCKEVLKVAKTAKGKVQNGQRLENGVWTPIMEDGEVVTNPEEVAELLPPIGGFFFGSTDIDGYYLDDVRHTIKQLDEALATDPEDDKVYYDYYYQSSW